MEITEKVLFVCTANICRSPMAAAIFNALAEDRGLPARAESAGTAALVGQPIASNAEAALQEVGIPCKDHRGARQVSEKMLEEADLVLTVGPRHTATLRQRFGEFAPKVHTLPEHADDNSSHEEIPDPYGSPLIAYRASVQQLLRLVDSVIGRGSLS